MCLLTAGTPHPAIKLWCQVPFTKSKTTFQIEMYCMQCFLKANILKVELSMIKIGELLRKLWYLRSCFNILPPGALTPQGIKGAMKRDVSKHWCTLQWCASRGWFIAHENWTSCDAYFGVICHYNFLPIIHKEIKQNMMVINIPYQFQYDCNLRMILRELVSPYIRMLYKFWRTRRTHARKGMVMYSVPLSCLTKQ